MILPPYPSDFSKELITYLNNIRYMDKYLGYYLDKLKENHLYERSTIIIVADHKPNVPKLNLGDKKDLCNHIPIVIVNPPCHLLGFTDKHWLEQTALFPTILDLFGIDSQWRGVGKSIFMPDSIAHTDFYRQRTLIQQELSEYILDNTYYR